jgi:hypothetical protein
VTWLFVQTWQWHVMAFLLGALVTAALLRRSTFGLHADEVHLETTPAPVELPDELGSDPNRDSSDESGDSAGDTADELAGGMPTSANRAEDAAGTGPPRRFVRRRVRRPLGVDPRTGIPLNQRPLASLVGRTVTADPADPDVLRAQLVAADNRVKTLRGELEQTRRSRTEEIATRDRQLAVLRARLATAPGAGRAKPTTFDSGGDRSSLMGSADAGTATATPPGEVAAEPDAEETPRRTNGGTFGASGQRTSELGSFRAIAGVGPGPDRIDTALWGNVGGRNRPASAETQQETPREAPRPPATPPPYGRGSAAPRADGSPPLGHSIKADSDAGVYHTVDSPDYARTTPDAWFASEVYAERAGFVRWSRQHLPDDDDYPSLGGTDMNGGRSPYDAEDHAAEEGTSRDAAEVAAVKEGPLDETLVEDGSEDDGELTPPAAEPIPAEPAAVDAATVEPAVEPMVDPAEDASEVAEEPEDAEPAALPAGATAPLPDGSAPDGHPIKVVEAAGAYHTPGSPYYDRADADLWFASEAAAQRAGYVRWDLRSKSV